MPLDAVTAVVDGIQLPGVSGEAGTAAAFAGHWAERTRSPARPVAGQRILEANDGVRVRLEVAPPRGMVLVPAVHRDRDKAGTVFEVAGPELWR